MEANSIVIFNNHFLKIIKQKKIGKHIIIIPKKNIKKAVLRSRMRRKIRNNFINLMENKQNKIIFIIKSFYDFKYAEYIKIYKKC